MAEGHPSEDGCSFLEDCCAICKLGFQKEKQVKVTAKGMLSLSVIVKKVGSQNFIST